MTDQKPTIGRIVWYRTDGRNGLSYDLPAIITVTPYTHPGDYPDGRSNPLPVPDDGRVHLTVFTPGGFGTRVIDSTESLKREPASSDFPDADDLAPGSGTYVEWNVPYAGDSIEIGADLGRTWRWPERA